MNPSRAIFVILALSIFQVTNLAAREASDVPLSAEEMAAFDEEPGRFPIKKLPNIANVGVKGDPLFPNATRIIWKSANEIFLDVDKYGSWTASKGDFPKIVILNVDTGEIKETGYRGKLNCFKPERMLVCPRTTGGLPCSKMDTLKGLQYGTPFLTGAYGDTLQPMDKEAHEGFDHETCEQYVPDQNIGKKVGDVTIVSHLGPNAGYVGYGNWSVGGQKYALLNNEAGIYWQTELHGGCESPLRTFNPWDDSYFIGHFFAQGNAQSSGACPPPFKHRVFLAQPGKAAEEIPLPELFDNWLKNHLASVGVAWSRRGLLLFTYSDNPYRQGLFWVDETGRIRRLMSKRYIKTAKVFPDGCKVLVQHYEGIKSYPFSSPSERQRLERTFETDVIDMCKGE